MFYHWNIHQVNYHPKENLSKRITIPKYQFPKGCYPKGLLSNSTIIQKDYHPKELISKRITIQLDLHSFKSNVIERICHVAISRLVMIFKFWKWIFRRHHIVSQRQNAWIKDYWISWMSFIKIQTEAKYHQQFLFLNLNSYATSFILCIWRFLKENMSTWF